MVFAEHGFADAKLEEIGRRCGVSRTAVLKHFGSKQDLFVEVFKYATSQLPTWFSEPSVNDDGFFATIRYWFERAARREHVDARYRVYYLGRYCSEMSVQRQVSIFMRQEDPDQTLEFVEFGMQRGEVDSTLDPYLVASYLDWVADSFQGGLFARELDWGGLSYRGPEASMPISKVDDVLEILGRALRPAASR